MKQWNRKEIVALLEESGRIAMHYKNDMAAEQKGDKTIVTKADRAIEAFLDEALTRGETDVYIIGEESLKDCQLEKALANTAFIIDPIDGTAVYAAGFSMWGISIGYAVNGKLQEGAIYLPDSQELMITDNGETFLRVGDQNEFQKVEPPRKVQRAGNAVAVCQKVLKYGEMDMPGLIQAIGSCVFPGVYMAKQSYQAGVVQANLWDVAGFLAALKNLGFCSKNRQGTDLMSLEISEELYSMKPAEGKILLKCCNVIAYTEEFCDEILSCAIFPEDKKK